jgi:5-methylcytosine-specific restriction enzyme B
MTFNHLLVDAVTTTEKQYWDQFVYWARKLHAGEQFDEQERDYKIEIAKRVDIARQAVLSGSPDWKEIVKRSFNSQNLVNHFAFGSYLRWLDASPDFALVGLQGLWQPEAKLTERIEAFFHSMPQRGVVDGPSNRLSLTSFLLLAIDYSRYPPYRTTPFDKAFQLTGSSSNLPRNVSEAHRYVHALEFLDRILDEAHSRGLKLRDRLDAQSVLWAITSWQTNHPPMSQWSEEEQAAFLRWRDNIPPDPGCGNEDCSLLSLANRLLLDHSYLQRVDDLLQSKKQLIFYGPPGTGKTYVARELARHYAGEDGDVQLVQFHPSYAYEDFIEGYRPHITSSGQPGFRLADGPLKRIAEAATEDLDAKFILVIDEINRGNVAKVLGELYFLLEYRDEEISLQYSSDPFKLPPNLWIIGTMNTADRSIALIDAALRRRFYFVPFMPDEPPVQGLLRRWLEREKKDLVWVADAVDRANEILGDRHMSIGPSYFMKPDLDERWVNLIWQHSILPYIAEQFFGEESRLDDFRLDRLCGLQSTEMLGLNAPANAE